MKNKRHIRKPAIQITIKNLQKLVPIERGKIKETVCKVLQSEGVYAKAGISFFFVTDKKIQALNLRYLGQDCPTDVIAFDSSGRDSILADIFISTETALSQARSFKTSVLYELYLYVIHGILHILGYDDLCSKDRAVMRKQEKLFLKALNIAPH
jgi:probable rRNA maturation factor